MRIPKALAAALITLGLSSAVSIVGFGRVEFVSADRASRLYGAQTQCNSSKGNTNTDYCTSPCSPIVNTGVGAMGSLQQVFVDCDEGNDSSDCEYPTWPDDGCTVPPP
ncbi:MAG: hypothetical protein ACLQIB_47495 [Isosphaeraceae bacterium]